MLVEECQILNPKKYMKKIKKDWFVVMTKPNQENRAITNMINQKFNVFYPFIKRQLFKSGKLTVVREFLFPSYLFVELNLTETKWYKINNTFGVKRILSFNEKPLSICRNFIGDLRKKTNEDFSLQSNYFDLTPKQKIKIKSGPFIKSLGEVINLVGKDRVKLLLNFVGDRKKIILEKNQVEPV